jgi:3-oxocholest-4-en-26-oyl-CoA dehydrogenase beta subunit
MDLHLNDAQRLLIESAESFLGERSRQWLRPEATDRSEQAIRELYASMAELGWMGLMVPEGQGGSGLTPLDAVLLSEQLGYHGCPVPYVTSVSVSTALLVACPRSRRRDQLLSQLAIGEALPGVALMETDGEWSLDAVIGCVLHGGKLTGVKRFVPNAALCDRFLVFCRGGGDGILRLLEVAAEQTRSSPMTDMAEQGWAEVAFDCEVAMDACLAEGETASRAFTAATEIGSITRAGQMVGLAARVLDDCVEHAKLREQSGRPIGGFQAIQHHLADMLRDIEGSRWISYRAAWQLGALEQVGLGVDAGMLVAMARAYTNERCLRAVRKAHQVMGAIGYCEAHPLQLLHKYLYAASLDYGETQANLDQVAAGLHAMEVA